MFARSPSSLRATRAPSGSDRHGRRAPNNSQPAQAGNSAAGVSLRWPLPPLFGATLMDEYREELYRDRAEWADIESEAEDAKKYTRVGGFWWKLLSWFQRQAKTERLIVQDEIDDLNERERSK